MLPRSDQSWGWEGGIGGAQGHTAEGLRGACLSKGPPDTGRLAGW